jgi:hypothetical protein
LLPGGCTISDLIAKCTAGGAQHAQFADCVAKLMASLKNDPHITGKQKGAIQSCAGRS